MNINTKEEFEELLKTTTVPILVDFWADWCGPCRMISPIIEEISKEYDGKITVVKINTDEIQELASKYEVRSIPTLVLIKDSVVISKLMGAYPKTKIKEFVDTNI